MRYDFFTNIKFFYIFTINVIFKAWSWAVKAVYELRDKNADILKLLVISHAIRVCSVLNKLSTAKKLINQLHTYEKEIDQNIYVDMLLNEACYSLKADLAKDSINSYYVRIACDGLMYMDIFYVIIITL